MRVLVTGAAGFIGSAVTMRLLDRGDSVVGLDNHNNYYDPALKRARLDRHLDHPSYTHYKTDLAERDSVMKVFAKERPNMVVNLAAQAGVRYSIENPAAYIDSNIVGFSNILEASRRHDIEHLVYASSSSVYGANQSMPFSAHDSVDHPLNVYAATKKANESLAHAYSHMHGLPCTGLRFFTVYGPWGRPDMAPFKFTSAMLRGEEVDIYNYGEHRRDFTYIDDIVEGISRVLDRPARPNPEWTGRKPDGASSLAPWRIYNIGNQSPVHLLDFIATLEEATGRVAKRNFKPMQPGDLPDTYADVSDLVRDTGYAPETPLSQGVENLVTWFKEFYRDR